MMTNSGRGIPSTVRETKDGLHLNDVIVTLTRKGEAQETIDPQTLPLRERAAFNKARNISRRWLRPRPLSRASYSMLISDLGFDLDFLSPKHLEDAETIPASCNTPLMNIRMSDLILFGYLLDMRLLETEPTLRKIGKANPPLDQFHMLRAV